MTVFNRSNDLIWGALGANVVHFSMLQEYMACCLGVEVGMYHQVSNNMHVYLNNFKPDEWVPTELRQLAQVYGPAQYPRLGPKLLVNKQQFDKEVSDIVAAASGHGDGWGYKCQEPWLQTVACPMLMAFYYHKRRDYEAAFEVLEQVQADDWRIAGHTWLQKRRDNYNIKQGKASV
jgi:hypothetical protein